MKRESDQQPATPPSRSSLVERLRARKMVDASRGYTRAPTEEEAEAADVIEALRAELAAVCVAVGRSKDGTGYDVDWHELHKQCARSESAPIPAGRRRVVCAAVRSADGLLLLGIRHYSQDMHQQIAEREDGNKFSHRNDDDQGFVDQHGEFMTREEAYKVAEAAGQIIRPEACGEGKLYSEGIY